MKGHTDYIWTIVLSFDNKYIISGSRDKTIRLWNFLNKTQETVLQGQLGHVNSVNVTTSISCLVLIIQ